MSSDDEGGGRKAANAAAVAAAFVDARRAGRALPAFPGALPSDLEAAYAVQDLAIARDGRRVAGWKVGYIAEARRDASGDDRLLGPVFADTVREADGEIDIAVFAGGFAAVEAEYVLRLDADAPAGKTRWTAAEAAELPSSLAIGLEVASSPLATINQLGPIVVVSDFGNNNGLVLGPGIAGWTGLDDAALTCETFIDEVSVGRGGASLLPGGLRAAFAFALARSAKRGRPLRAGDLVATGNATGIHDILPGQRARILFEGHGEIRVRARAVSPFADTGPAA
ncbi:MAG TPA: 2-keto-4-pentenoate hydratase [Luteimonas sp.]|nr:2-keto-4-pentenoate hydratase [Luteimonas sp.]